MTFRIGLAVLSVALAFGGTVAAQTPAATATAADWRVIAPENLWVIDTTQGRILVELDPRVAPGHVERIRTLTNRGFYDGLKFHRVIRGFMAQTGDPQGTGEGNSDLPDLPPEFSFRRGTPAGFAPVRTNAPGIQGLVGSIPVVTQPDAQMFVTADFKVDATGLFCPGVAGMARSAGVDSANSQFFLMMGQNDNLNGAYTVFGRVVAGLDIVEKLKIGDDANNGAVTDPDVMSRVRIASAMPETERPVVRVMDARSAAFAARVEAVRADKGNGFKLCDVQPVAEVTGG
jgi:peptidylprolyl isomerase